MKPAILALLALGSMALGQNDPFEKKCAELASSPHDSGKTGAGVPFAEINVREALTPCGEAVKRRSSNARNHFHFGRVLEAATRFSEARAGVICFNASRTVRDAHGRHPVSSRIRSRRENA